MRARRPDGRPRGREGGELLRHPERPEDDDPASRSAERAVAGSLAMHDTNASVSPASASWAAAWPASFLDKGFPLTVWNRTPERCEPLAAAGRAGGAHAARAGRERPTWWSPASPTRPRSGRIVFAEDGIRPAARPGFRYLETSTISPGPGAARRRGAAGARARDMLEAPVTGSKTGRGEGHAAPDDRRPARAPRRADAGDDGHRVEGRSTAARSARARS